MTGEQPLTHERAIELLPWLINGTLRTAERDAVEHHVRMCIACRRELKEQQRLQTALRGQPTVHVSARSGLALLDSRLDSLRPGAGTWAHRYRNFRPFAVAAGIGAPSFVTSAVHVPLYALTRSIYAWTMSVQVVWPL